MSMTPGPWYEASTGNHQGLIVSETTGENIAVTYKKEDAGPIAALPALVEAAREAWNYLQHRKSGETWIDPEMLETMLDAALAAYEGKEGE